MRNFSIRLFLRKALSILFLAFFMTSVGYAQAGESVIKYKLSSGESGLNQQTVTDCDAGFFCIKSQSTGNFIQNAFNLAVGISISVAVLLLIFQGTALLLAEYGIGDLSSSGIAKAQHKKDLLNPIVGLIIVFCSVVVIRTLNPDLLSFPVFDQLNFETTAAGAGEAAGPSLTNGR